MSALGGSSHRASKAERKHERERGKSEKAAHTKLLVVAVVVEVAQEDEELVAVAAEDSLDLWGLLRVGDEDLRVKPQRTTSVRRPVLKGEGQRSQRDLDERAHAP